MVLPASLVGTVRLPPHAVELKVLGQPRLLQNFIGCVTRLDSAIYAEIRMRAEIREIGLMALSMCIGLS